MSVARISEEDALHPFRRLLEHCAGNDTLMGTAPVWASIIILLVLGFVVGVVSGALSVYYWYQRQWNRQIEVPYEGSAQFVGNDAQADVSSWVPAVLRHKRTISAQLESARNAGPLSVGLQNDGAALHTIVPMDNPAFRSSAETTASLTGSPIQLMRTAAPQPEVIPIEKILEPQHSLVKEGSTIKAITAEMVQSEAHVKGGSTLAHQAVMTVQPDDSSAKEAQKAKDAAAVGAAYDMDDLDDEWKELLSQIDAQLLTLKRQTMDSQERAVAIRSLLVSTARETPEQAIAKAIDDVERFRRVQAR